MNIFTAAVTGLTIVIKKIGIGFKAVMTGLKIAIISVIDFIASVITAIINAIVSAIKWVLTQIVNLIHLLFRTYLRLEAGCVPPVQKFAGLMIRLRWGFVILSGLYAVYKYLGITALLVGIAVCGILILIGYSEAEKEEEEWNNTLDKLNELIKNYLKYLIRLSIMTSSVYLLFHNKIVITPVWNNKLVSNNVRTLPTKEPNLPKEVLQGFKFLNGQSHPPAEEMRANHMEILEDMHVTAKGYSPAKDGKKQTMMCLMCHSGKEQFCDSCHAYTSVKTSDCWLCHVKP